MSQPRSHTGSFRLLSLATLVFAAVIAINSPLGAQHFGGHPTVHPSGHPTVHPSGHPTVHPGGHPAVHPSGHPTVHPSGHPTVHPSGHPTVHPGGHPAVHPGGHPAVHPSGRPTVHPSGHPTVHPRPDFPHGPRPNPSTVGNNRPRPGLNPSVPGNNQSRPNRPSQNRPSVTNNTTVNNTVVTNVTNINYSTTANGFVVGGNSQCDFTSGCTLDPGDVIVSIGGISCGNSNRTLQELTCLAYQNGNQFAVVRDCNTGDLLTIPLDPPENGGAAAGDDIDLANTSWAGNEDLGGYGRLEFRFGDDGQVTMIDTDGSRTGTYSVQGNDVTLSFYNGTVVYRGSYDGSAISGTAQNSRTTWNFSVDQ